MAPDARHPIPRLPRFMRALFEPAPPASDEDIAAFWEDQRVQGLRNWRMFVLFCAVCTLLWWPTDWYFYRHVPHAMEPFAIARAVAAGCMIIAFFGVKYVPLMRRFPIESMMAMGLVVIFFAAWMFARSGPPSQLWFHFGHFLMLAPVAVTLRPKSRAVYGVLIATCYLGGYFGTHPEYLEDPLAGAAINFHLFTGVFSWVAGVGADHLRFRGFILHRIERRQAEELRLLKEGLERLVDERTREVRHLSAHLETVRESERLHLARELHDELGQELTALRYAVELAVRRYGSDPQSIQPNLADLAAMVQRTRIATRDLVAELRPRALDELGLVAAADALVRRMRERSGIDIEMTIPPEVPLAPDVATAGYRILQECLTNAVRHAQPTRIEVTLRRDPETLVVTVRDDGVGFERAKVTSGFGLLGMRERAATNGIVLHLESAPGHGTRVEARLPIAPEAQVSMVSAA